MQIHTTKTRYGGSSPVVSVIFVIVGVGLLAGAAAAYYFLIHRPQTWPKVSGTIASSRVVNPTSPSRYKAELVFSLEDRGTERQVTTVASWDSSSYDMVRSYVDGFPAGATVSLAVNPEDPDDVRHEVGVTLANAMVPGALGVMGLLFAAVGLVTLRPGAANANTAPQASQSVRWIGTLFMGIGVLVGAVGGWLLTGDTALDWPTTDATVVDGTIVSMRSTSSSRGSSRPSYDIQVTFSYAVNGTSYKSQTTSGSSSGSRDDAASRLDAYAPGSRHAIRYRPDDANVIRFAVTRFDVYVLPVAMLGMGAVFLFVGLLVSRIAPATGRGTIGTSP